MEAACEAGYHQVVLGRRAGEKADRTAVRFAVLEQVIQRRRREPGECPLRVTVWPNSIMAGANAVLAKKQAASPDALIGRKPSDIVDHGVVADRRAGQILAGGRYEGLHRYSL